MQYIGEAAFLAIVQGVTEFLPISSSAHLALAEIMLGFRDQGIAFEIAVHMGTLFAVLIYFREDLTALIVGAWKLLRGQRSQEGNLALALFVATLPILPAGVFLLRADWRILFLAIEPIAWMNLVFAILLYLADRYAFQGRDMKRLSLLDALLIGIAQVLALLPGVSRAGIAITMGRALGFPRIQAARFSMLLAIPAIIASGATLFIGSIAPESSAIPILLFGGVLACLAALAVIALFLRILAHCTLLVFVLYRVGLSVVLLVGIYFYFP